MTTGNLTIQDNDTVDQYTAVGESSFVYNFPILAASELKVSRNQVLLTYGADYSVSGIGADGGGTITLLTGASTPGDVWTLWQDMPIERLTGFSPGAAALLPEALNADLARPARVEQQLRREIRNAMRLAPDDPVSGQDMVLPAILSRAGKFLAFDANGKPVPATGVGGADSALRTDLANGLTGPGHTLVAHRRTALESTTGKVPANYLIPSHEECGVLYVDRYQVNAVPGTTNMSTGLQHCIDIALAAYSTGRRGIPIRFFADCYRIATAITWPGAAVNLLPLDIGGAGWASTQLLCDIAAGTSALWPMNNLDGWFLHDFLMYNDAAHANIGIQAGFNSGTIEWRIARVVSMMHGPAGIKCELTNTGIIEDYSHWPGNNPDLIVNKALTAASIGHGIWGTGNFFHNVHIKSPWVNSHSGYGTPAGAQRGIFVDAVFSFGVTIDGAPLAQTLSGQFNEIGIEFVPTNFADSLIISGLYLEGSTLRLKNIQNSLIGPITNGDVGGAVRIEGVSRFNTFIGIHAGVVDIIDGLGFSEGNTFIGCRAAGILAWSGVIPYFVGNYVLQGGTVYRCILAHTNQVPPNVTYWTACEAFNDGSEGANLSNSPTKLINSFGTTTVGKDWRKLLAYATPTLAAIDCLGPNHRVVRVSGGGAMTFPTPLHPKNGHELVITMRNEFGAMGAITWFAAATGWVNPANNFNRSICWYYDSDFGTWKQKWISPADVAN